jgi:hypothetical protein
MKKMKPKLHSSTKTRWHRPPLWAKPAPPYGQRSRASIDSDSAEGLEILLQICSAAEYAAIIDKQGPMINTKHGPREHPLVWHELAARSFVVRSLSKLSPQRVGRPGYGGIGISWKDLQR